MYHFFGGHGDQRVFDADQYEFLEQFSLCGRTCHGLLHALLIVLILLFSIWQPNQNITCTVGDWDFFFFSYGDLHFVAVDVERMRRYSLTPLQLL